MLQMNAKSFAVILLGLSCGLIFLGQDIRVAVRIRAFDLGMVLIAALFAWHAIRDGVRRDTAPYLIAFGAFALYVTCNALLQVSRGTAIKELAQLLFFLTFFMAMAQYVSTRRATVLFLGVFLGTLWLLALQNGFFHASRGMYAGWKELGDRKLAHSVIFVLMVIITVSPLRPKGWWWVALLVLAIVFLLLSGERKGWIAAFIGVMCALMISDDGGIGRRALVRTFSALVGIAAVIGVAAILAPYVPYLEKQLVSSVDFVALLFADEEVRRAADTTQSNEGRLATIEIGFQHIREHPIFGIGPEQFKKSSAALAFLPIAVDDLKGAHNELLRITAELGFVGLAFYGLVNLTLLYRATQLVAIMGRLDDFERLRVRLGIALFFYGFAVNIFLAGGGLNTFFVMLPAGLLFSVHLTAPNPAPYVGSRPPIQRSFPGPAQ